MKRTQPYYTSSYLFKCFFIGCLNEIEMNTTTKGLEFAMHINCLYAESKLKLKQYLN